jgi:Xaa-Pro aminopeptidase
VTTAPIDRIGRFVQALDAAVQERTVATEVSFSSLAMTQFETVDVTERLARLRVIKSEDELQALRDLAGICDAGQAAARARLAPGVTELELWVAAQNAMEARAGSRLTIVADVVSGPRAGAVSGDPTDRQIRRGEAVIVDLLPRHHGYWGDSTSTLALEPRPDVRRGWKQVADVLEQLVLAVRPGVRAHDLDALGREALHYPHHTGHGIGTSFHEEPRLVPGNHIVLAEGMVIALEPALYTADFGVRLEQVVLVEKDGAAILSGHTVTL